MELDGTVAVDGITRLDLLIFGHAAHVAASNRFCQPDAADQARLRVASGAYRTEPSFQRFLQAKAERMRERGEPVDLWN